MKRYSKTFWFKFRKQYKLIKYYNKKVNTNILKNKFKR